MGRARAIDFYILSPQTQNVRIDIRFESNNRARSKINGLYRASNCARLFSFFFSQSILDFFALHNARIYPQDNISLTATRSTAAAISHLTLSTKHCTQGERLYAKTVCPKQAYVSKTFMV